MSTVRERILVVGSGVIGARVFFELAQSATGCRVHLLGRNGTAVEQQFNLARFAAMQRGKYPKLSRSTCDVRNTEALAAEIAAFRPDVVFLAVSLQSWWFITQLPQGLRERLAPAHYGPWLPMHLAPVLWSMRALQMSGQRPVVVNAAFPDAVHPALHGAALSPDIGVGNVANNVPALRVIAADTLAADVEEVEVSLIAHHYVTHAMRYGSTGGARAGLYVSHRGVDVTDQVPLKLLLEKLSRDYVRTPGIPGQSMVAAAALSVIEPLIEGRSTRVHAPGVDGRVGGYPVLIGTDSISVDLPTSFSPEDAEDINLDGQRFDGISRISAGGRIEFTESSAEVMKNELGYDCAFMHFEEAPERARELGEKLALRIGLGSPTDA